MKKRFTPSIGLQGGSSLIVIFGVLCIVVFAVLALSSSLATTRLEKSSVDATSAYYAADMMAEEKLAELREQGVDGIYSYTCEVSERQEICVTVKITGDNYEILSWQTKYTAPWQADNSLQLWSGN